MPTGSKQVVGPRNAPPNSPELCIERKTLASHEVKFIASNLFITQHNDLPKDQLKIDERSIY